jgi:hypothetical protein
MRTVPPIARTVSGAHPLPIEPVGSAPVTLKPKAKFPTAAVVLLLLAGAGFGGWKFLGSKRAADTRVTSVGSDPMRRFHVYVKSTPDGADIFLGEGKRPIGATPVTLPIDLTGVTSVKLTLKKAGYEDYQQIVVDDTPLSISLTAVGAPPPAPAPAPGAPGGQAPDQGGGSGAAIAAGARPSRRAPRATNRPARSPASSGRPTRPCLVFSSATTSFIRTTW